MKKPPRVFGAVFFYGIVCTSLQLIDKNKTFFVEVFFKKLSKNETTFYSVCIGVSYLFL